LTISFTRRVDELLVLWATPSTDRLVTVPSATKTSRLFMSSL
jgi:hypothetical protein